MSSFYVPLASIRSTWLHSVEWPDYRLEDTLFDSRQVQKILFSKSSDRLLALQQYHIKLVHGTFVLEQSWWSVNLLTIYLLLMQMSKTSGSKHFFLPYAVMAFTGTSLPFSVFYSTLNFAVCTTKWSAPPKERPRIITVWHSGCG